MFLKKVVLSMDWSTLSKKEGIAEAPLIWPRAAMARKSRGRDEKESKKRKNINPAEQAKQRREKKRLQTRASQDAFSG